MSASKSKVQPSPRRGLARKDNVGLLVQTADYDPYGNILSMSGPLAEANLYRFSSKEFHPNSGLAYYLYRYYEPNLQRWINRDPIAELGGLNLFRGFRNNPLTWFDPYGLDDEEETGWGEKIRGFCDKLADKIIEYGDLVKERLLEKAEEPVGKRGPLPTSPVGGVATAVGGAVVEAGAGFSQTAPGLLKIGVMQDEKIRLLMGDDEDFDQAFKRHQNKASKCDDLNKKD